ncbi:MutS-related protein, family 1 [Lachnospiraceae bacterium KM106-2]|nr:MutS-related protein, family 1 [Lachnospiraceae bacterium KM106-2]
MELVIIVVAILIGLVIKSILDNKKNMQVLEDEIRNRWGKAPVNEYTQEKYDSIKKYYEANKGKNDVDDITWNDINMDDIYFLMNQTSSSFGEEYLYSMLHKLQFEEDPLIERDQLIRFFMEHPEERAKIQVALAKLGKMNNISLYEYVNRTSEVKYINTNFHRGCIFSLIAAIALIFVNPFLGLVGTMVAISHNLLSYYKTKGNIENYFAVFGYVIRMTDCLSELGTIQNDEVKEYIDELTNINKKFTSFKRGSWIVVAGKQLTGGFADLILDNFRMLFHVDLLKFNQMLREFRKHQEDFNYVFDTLGLLDSCIAVGNFRTWLNGNYCEPNLEQTKVAFIKADNLYHPLLSDPVSNSIFEKRPVLITGSNASGKSTFLKTLAINAILSQTIYTSLSSAYHASYFKVMSSMALKDDIFNHESYYIVEIKSLKRILDQLEDEIPTLCFVDEVLRGTNTLERIAASSQILMSFARRNAICFAATHDIELTHILENYYSNYHFQEEITDDKIVFDYQLNKGRATSKNAINLLKLIGYDKNIIDSANEQANDFLKNGTWESFQ